MLPRFNGDDAIAILETHLRKKLPVLTPFLGEGHGTGNTIRKAMHILVPPARWNADVDLMDVNALRVFYECRAEDAAFQNTAQGTLFQNIAQVIAEASSAFGATEPRELGAYNTIPLQTLLAQKAIAPFRKNARLPEVHPAPEARPSHVAMAHRAAVPTIRELSASPQLSSAVEPMEQAWSNVPRLQRKSIAVSKLDLRTMSDRKFHEKLSNAHTAASQEPDYEANIKPLFDALEAAFSAYRKALKDSKAPIQR